MSDLLAAQRLALATAKMTARELAFSADLAALAGENDRCIAIIARIYEMFNDQSYQIPAKPSKKDAATETTGWIGRQERSARDRPSRFFEGDALVNAQRAISPTCR